MAIKRYEFTNKYIETKKGECFETTTLPSIPKSSGDRYIFSRDGDRLDNLAYDLYGDPRHWTILAPWNVKRATWITTTSSA